MTTDPTGDPTGEPQWYRDAIIYQAHVKAYFDSDNDGVGDLRGLIDRLDHLKDLGVTAVWLLPFYPSPLKDDGYDIADYRKVNPSYGTLKDFRAFVRGAHDRGLKVITELVINHTSDQHPWFQRARAAHRGSRWRNFYVWSDDDKQWPETRIIFTDTEASNWTWDPVAGQYYWHRFFSHQPDLNFDNPEVRRAVISVMRFWLDMGVDGLRLDAIPYLVERDGTVNENLPETHAVLRELRAAMDESHPNAFFLAEANQWPEDTLPYFGEGDECHMAFHFPLMPRMYMAIAQEDRHPITDILRQTPPIPEGCQWAVFLRNHDELTLEMVTDRERDWMWQFYAADQRARINLGIRRRLAPLMDNDRRKIELMNSLLFSMPGTPVVYYGDEIGMGDNFFLGDRDGVRTPMQWSPDRNGGFSRADPPFLYLPAIMDPIYGFQTVNVEAQNRSATSLLNWMKRIIQVRQQSKVFGRGALNFLYPGNRKILAYTRELQGEDGEEAVLCVANLSRQAQAVELDLSRFRGAVPVELLGRSAFPPIGELTYLLTLQPYGFYWFRLTGAEEAPAWHEAIPDVVPDFVTLVVRQGWAALAEGRTRGEVEEALGAFIANQRWYAAKAAKAEAWRLTHLAPMPGEGETVALALVEVDLAGEETQSYFAPLAKVWDESATLTGTPTLPFTVAKIRRFNRLGALVDASAVPGAMLALLSAIAEGTELPLAAGDGRIRFVAGSRLAELDLPSADSVRRMGVEQSNTSIVFGDMMVLKLIRRLAVGIHPEVEIGRFLTEAAGFPNIPPMLGTVERIDAAGEPTALAVLQGFQRNQGDGWTYTLNYLGRELEEVALEPAEARDPADRYVHYVAMAATLGRRTAELHAALATPTSDPAFAAEPFDASDIEALRRALHASARAALRAVRSAEARLSAAEADVAALVSREAELFALIDRLTGQAGPGCKTRVHGDLHLGQVLVDQADFIFVDFEGEPARPLAERRAKQHPLRDLAGLIRSFDYAAVTATQTTVLEDPERLEAVRRSAMAWRDLATAACVDAYFATAGGESGEEALPMLMMLVLEKALYEIGYEGANRPDWLGIPVAGVLELLTGEGVGE